MNNPLKIMHDSKAMIMTSIWEGTPMCALEAMALGVPLFTTPVDGLKSIISNDINGYMADDDIKLAERIVYYIQNESKLRNLRDEQLKLSKICNDSNNYFEKINSVYKGGI